MNGHTNNGHRENKTMTTTTNEIKYIAIHTDDETGELQWLNSARQWVTATPAQRKATVESLMTLPAATRPAWWHGEMGAQKAAENAGGFETGRWTSMFVRITRRTGPGRPAGAKDATPRKRAARKIATPKAARKPATRKGARTLTAEAAGIESTRPAPAGHRGRTPEERATLARIARAEAAVRAQLGDAAEMIKMGVTWAVALVDGREINVAL